MSTSNSASSCESESNDSNDSTISFIETRGPKKGIKRGPYRSSASLETRIRILNAADRGEDWHDVARANGVKPSTARTWISRGSASFKARGTQRGNAHNTKITNQIKSFLLNELSIDPQLTLKEMSKRILQQFNVSV